MLEKEIQAKVIKYARDKGCICYKMDATNAIGVPDYLVCAVNGDMFFIEFKQKGKLPTAMQYREHDRLMSNNCRVYVVDNVELGISIINSELNK